MTFPARPISDDERLTPIHYGAVRPDGLSFMHCLNETAGCIELVQQFDRLYGATLVSSRHAIEKMIDEATGKHDDDMQAFLRFVWNFVFLRTPLTGA
jgi:hypothetical protein